MYLVSPLHCMQNQVEVKTRRASSSSSPHLGPPLAAERTENRTVSSSSSAVLHSIFATSESFADDIKGEARFGYVCLYLHHSYPPQHFLIFSAFLFLILFFLPSIVAFSGSVKSVAHQPFAIHINNEASQQPPAQWRATQVQVQLGTAGGCSSQTIGL